MRLRYVSALLVFVATNYAQGPDPIWNVNPATLQCIPNNQGLCFDVAIGPSWLLEMSANALCNNGQNVTVYSSVQAINCSDWAAYGTVQITISDYPSMVLTDGGWVERWIGGLVDMAEGSDDIAVWLGWDANYCDTYRSTYTPPWIPC
jgi:hypothetical protein